MQSKDTGHEMTQWVVVEVTADVANTYTIITSTCSIRKKCDSPVVPKGRQLQRRHISSSSLCILLTDPLHLTQAQWIDQCMKWLYTREAALTASHLCLYHAAQLSKVGLPCAPVTDEVQAVEVLQWRVHSRFLTVSYSRSVMPACTVQSLYGTVVSSRSTTTGTHSTTSNRGAQLQQQC
eukprot:19964-Heterococcus_DN1.PRE.2